MPLLDHLEEHLSLGIRAMDRDHREFVDLVRRMGDARDATFVYLYDELLEHTRGHFANEEVLLRQTAMPTGTDHLAEHVWLLAELERYAKELKRGRIGPARTFITQHLPFWFTRHALERDAALARHLKDLGAAGQGPDRQHPADTP